MASRKRPPAPKAETSPPARKKSKPKAAPAEDAPAPETVAHALVAASADKPADKPRKVGLRRVAGYALCERLYSRRGFRPAGNSRRFWSRVETEDPFLPQPQGHRWEDEGPTLQTSMQAGVREPAAATRIARTEPSQANTSSKAQPKPQAQAKPQPKPQAQAKPPPKPQPKPKPPPEPEAYEDEGYEEEPPRPAPRAPAKPPPQPTFERAGPPPGPPARAEVPAGVDRRPPRIVPDKGGAAGRVAANPSSYVPRPRLVNSEGKTAAEVRQETEAARRGPPGPPRARGLDEILGILGDLGSSERLYRQGLLKKSNEEEEAPKPPPKPRAAAPSQQPRPQPPRKPAQRAPEPEPEPEEYDEPEPTPPPAPSRPEPKLDRSPSRALTSSTGGSLDDLFGGGDTRMKIGKRTLRKQAETEEP